METKYISGVKVNMPITMQESLHEIEKLLATDKSYIVSTTNAEFIMDAQKDTKFKEILNSTALSLPDGSGVLFANAYLEKVSDLKKDNLFKLRAIFAGLSVGLSNIFNNTIEGEKVSGVDLSYKLAELSSSNDYSVFLLGGWPKDSFGNDLKTDRDIATEAADKLRKLYPNVNIIGATSQFSYKDYDDQSSVDYIKVCMQKSDVKHLDILLVAYNHVEALKWINRNMNKIPSKINIGVGGTFDYISEHVKRAPKAVIKMNLEWLYRLITQPWRIARIKKAFPGFPLYIFKNSIKRH